jgi:hypothetical protein
LSVSVHHGDCRDVLATLPEASIDACVTDPPYGLEFMGKGWDKGVPGVEFWAEVFRVLKPGAHLLAFGGTRTYHRLVCAIEDAGFDVRDQIGWAYGTGFPKSLDVSKAIDSRKDWVGLAAFQGNVKAARTALGISQSEAARRIGLIASDESLGGGGFMWFETGMRLPTAEQYAALKRELLLSDACDGAFEAAEREVIGQHRASAGGQNMRAGIGGQGVALPPGEITAPASDAARAWAGWGTALKPAWEPICVARKPLVGTVAANVLRFGTGALNIDGCRVEASDKTPAPVGQFRGSTIGTERHSGIRDGRADHLGRWPANLVHDGSDEVLDLFPETAGGGRATRGASSRIYGGGKGFTAATGEEIGFADSGSAARFFKSCPMGDEDWRHLESLDQIARSAGSPSDSCETPTAGDLAATATSGFKSGGSPATPASTGNSGGSIPTPSPADAADQESTGTTPTIPNLSKSSGFAPPVTGSSINSDGAAKAADDSDPVKGTRFLYCPKASRSERGEGNAHPTVKPVALMRWLVRLVTPPGGTVLDPFAGSGTTGLAAMAEGFAATLIEAEAPYTGIIASRMERARATPVQETLI